MLAFDVSASMAATDLTPDPDGRREGRGARRSCERQPPTVRVGVVAFGGSGLVTQQPTADRASVLAAIDRLQPAGRHGAGQRAADLAERDRRADGAGRRAGHVEPASSAQGPDLGYHGSAAVVLLSDGENTAEPDPVDVAELASERGRAGLPDRARVSREGTVIEVDGFQLATALDEPTLRDDRRAHRRHATSRRPTRTALAGVYDADRPGVDGRRPSTSRSPRLLAAAAALLAARAASGCRCSGSGGRSSDGRSPGRSRSWRCSPCRCSPARTCGSCAAGAGRRCGTPASR